MSEPVTARKQVSLERTFDASLEEVWKLWTTKAGIEAWWGPDGFEVQVHSIDVRPGGQLDYAMTAVEPDQIDFLKKAGMPLKSEHRNTFLEVVPQRRLVYRNTVDFVPGVKPYEVTTWVQLEATAAGVTMKLTFEAMHDERWTQLATMGWENELAKLERALRAS